MSQVGKLNLEETQDHTLLNGGARWPGLELPLFTTALCLLTMWLFHNGNAWYSF